MLPKGSPSTAVSPKKPARRVFGLGKAAIAGAFVVMALALGWLVWFQAQRSSPTSPEALIAQAAEAYGQSGDIAQARQRLAGLDANRLAQSLAKMEADAPDEATRQRLVALQKALELPPITPNLWSSLFSQKLIPISLVLAAVPLLGALGLDLLATLQQPAESEAEVDVPPADALAEAAVVKAQPGAKPQLATASAQTAPPEVHPAPAAQQTPPQADATLPETEPAIQEILSSVFEGEIATLRYEVLLGDLMDIQASDLLSTGRRVAQELRVLAAPPRDQEGK